MERFIVKKSDQGGEVEKVHRIQLLTDVWLDSGRLPSYLSMSTFDDLWKLHPPELGQGYPDATLPTEL